MFCIEKLQRFGLNRTIALTVSCIGCIAQIYYICDIYFKYPVNVVVVVSIPDEYEIVSHSWCYTWQAAFLKAKVTENFKTPLDGYNNTPVCELNDMTNTGNEI